MKKKEKKIFHILGALVKVFNEIIDKIDFLNKVCKNRSN